MILAFDTATEQMSVGLDASPTQRVLDTAGGSLASAALVPLILAMLADAGIGVRDLDAIAFGRGPGAFTGLRTACSVAQGLALGAGKPVLPIDTLLAVAEDARRSGFEAAADLEVWVAMDARMGEIYAAHYAFTQGCWATLVAPLLIAPESLNQRWRDQERTPSRSPVVVAGNALAAFEGRLQPGAMQSRGDAMPRAHALLALARSQWAAGAAVDAALALPLYLRDKVALTSAERDTASANRASR